MKLMFNKKELYGKWFSDEEENNDWTEKVPPNTGYEFNEELGEWVEKQPEIIEEENDEK